jgi:hypothetical protein
MITDSAADPEVLDAISAAGVAVTAV